MNPSPRTERPVPTDTRSAPLEDRILQAELRLIAREHRLWRGVSEIQARARASLQPRRLLRPLAIAGGVGLVGVATWWLFRRGRSARRDAAEFGSGPACAERSSGGDRVVRDGSSSRWRTRIVTAVGVLAVVPWIPVMNLVWPLLPARLKQRTTPLGAAATLSVGLPWIARFGAPQHSLGSTRLWLTSLNSMWAGYSSMKQRRSPSPQTAAQGRRD